MRRSAVVLAATIVLFGVGLAQAAITTVKVVPGDYVQMSLGSQYFSQNGETGGEFGMTVWDSSASLKGTFFTFCADPTTFMNLGTTYHVKTVANSNHLGNQISDYGKWIFYQYGLNETLNSDLTTTPSSIPGHVSGSSFTTTVMGAIQEGIWLNLTKSGTNNFSNTVASDGNYPAGWNTNVYSTYMNSWIAAYIADTSPTSLTYNSDGFETYKKSIQIAELTLDGGDVQNQMVFTLSIGSGVPEPATIAIWWLLGIVAGLGTVIWRRAK
jgi:hypothetical protein